MGFIGILYALPIQAGNGLTKTGNVINLGGELTDVVNFHTIDDNNTITINDNNYIKSFTFGVTGIDGTNGNTGITSSINTNAGTIEIHDIFNYKDTVITPDGFGVINNGNETFTANNYVVRTINPFQNMPNALFKLIDASPGITVPDTLIEMEINGNTYQIPAKS